MHKSHKQTHTNSTSRSTSPLLSTPKIHRFAHNCLVVSIIKFTHSKYDHRLPPYIFPTSSTERGSQFPSLFSKQLPIAWRRATTTMCERWLCGTCVRNGARWAKRSRGLDARNTRRRATQTTRPTNRTIYTFSRYKTQLQHNNYVPNTTTWERISVVDFHYRFFGIEVHRIPEKGIKGIPFLF